DKNNNWNQEQVKNCPFLNDFLDKFHSSRIGARLLTGQLSLMHKQLNKKNNNNNNNNYNGNGNGNGNQFGLINSSCCVKEIIEMSYDDASKLCQQQYSKIPELNI